MRVCFPIRPYRFRLCCGRRQIRGLRLGFSFRLSRTRQRLLLPYHRTRCCWYIRGILSRLGHIEDFILAVIIQDNFAPQYLLENCPLNCFTELIDLLGFFGLFQNYRPALVLGTDDGTHQHEFETCCLQIINRRAF